MSNLRDMQHEHRAWMNHNFPNQTADDAMLGMVEEMGELAHAILKNRQKIRGVGDEKVMELIIDAHCDWIIFSLGFANLMGYDLQTELEHTWTRVRDRDWIANPTGDGFE